MIEQLHWDSDFFGYSVGRILLSDNESIDLIKSDETNKFKLIYIFSNQKLEIKGTRLKLVDIKTTLIKKITSEDALPIHTSISEYSNNNDEKLKLLALESGVYSRFKCDSNFIHNEYSKLYTKWIEESINKKIADKLIIFNEEIEGFVSLKFKDNFSEIGLIAVDSNSRGKGIALSLLKATFNLTAKMNLPNIRIVTQFENTPAMKLYQKAGFEIESKKYIYHLWNE